MKKIYVVPAVGVVFVGMTNVLLAGSNITGDADHETNGGGGGSKPNDFDEWDYCEDEEDVGV